MTEVLHAWALVTLQNMLHFFLTSISPARVCCCILHSCTLTACLWEH